MSITTHVLDTARGKPAAGVKHQLDRWDAAQSKWETVASGVTDADGRNKNLFPAGHALARGQRFRLTFDTEAYQPGSFFPVVEIQFVIQDPASHHHVPLLLSPYGYSTYRGS